MAAQSVPLPLAAPFPAPDRRFKADILVLVAHPDGLVRGARPSPLSVAGALELSDRDGRPGTGGWAHRLANDDVARDGGWAGARFGIGARLPEAIAALCSS